MAVMGPSISGQSVMVSKSKCVIAGCVDHLMPIGNKHVVAKSCSITASTHLQNILSHFCRTHAPDMGVLENPPSRAMRLLKYKVSDALNLSFRSKGSSSLYQI